MLIAQTVGWAGLICPRARRGSSVGIPCLVDESPIANTYGANRYAQCALRAFFCFCKKKVTKEKQPRMPRPFGVPNISKKCRATKTTRLAEEVGSQQEQQHAILKQFSWKPPTLFQNVGAATREFSNATGCAERADSKMKHLDANRKGENSPLPRTEWCLHRKAGAQFRRFTTTKSRRAP